MDNEKMKNIVDKFLLEYPEIDTVLLFGSALDASWTEKSDVDIFFIGDSLEDSRIEATIDDVAIEVQVDNFNSLLEKIKYEEGKLLNRNVANMIDSSSIIRTKSNDKLNNLKIAARKTLESKTVYDDEDVAMWKYSIEDYLAKAQKDATRDDAVAFYYDSHYVIQNLLEMTLATHGLYFPQPKRLSEVLDRIAPKIRQKIDEFVATSALSEAAKILNEMCE